MKRRNKFSYSLIISVLLSLLVIVYAVYKLDWDATRIMLMNVNLSWLGLALAIYIINYILRSIRFQILIYSQNVPFIQLMGVTGLYGMFNYLLPGKLGELTYLVLLNRRLRISLVETTSTLLASRFLDFAVIAFILPFILVAFWKDLPVWIIYASLSFCGCVFAIMVGFCLLVRRRINSTAENQTSKVGWFAKINQLLIDLQDGLITIHKQGNYIPLILLTAGVWMCVYTNLYLIALSLGYDMNYFQAVIISIIMIPMTLLPFQGFANLGTHEIGWVAAFAIFGEPESMALTIAFGSHVILLALVLLLGACSFFTLIPKGTLSLSERINQ